jgi:hypothetical protein
VFTIAGRIGWTLSGFGGLLLFLFVLPATGWQLAALIVCYVGGCASTLLLDAGASIRD